MRWVTRILPGLAVIGAGLGAMATGATAQPASVIFAASGDLGTTASTQASLAALAASGAGFYLSLGDLSYGLTGAEAAWCDLIKSYVTPAFPFELVAGNHEDDAHANGFIDSFAACLPDRMGAAGRYGAEYYFDAAGLVRVILIAPDLQVGGETYHYVPGSPHYDWLVARIDEARAAGLPWVVVGMHKVCITVGVKTCEIGSDLMDLLITKRVDLVLHGHDHTYQRSKQLMCAFENRFDSSCVANDGVAGRYAKGAGTVFVIAGAFGQSLYAIAPTDPEAPYFARAMGLNMDPTFGFVKIMVTATELVAEFVAAGGGAFADRFSIEPAADFELIGVHPQASAQPTALGRIVAGLVGWKGRLYTGYGDINANTGPIAVTSWDPAAETFGTHWVSQTEAIYNYRPIGGRLSAPAIDPRGTPQADFAVGEPWEDRVPVGTWHAFDMVTLTGADLWVVGQQTVDAVAWRSLDGGATWAEMVRISPDPSTAEVLRFHFGGVYQGKLYLQLVGFGGSAPTSLVFDGATWSNGPSLLPVAGAQGWRPVVFAGRMVYRSQAPLLDSASRLLAFDGQQAMLPLAASIYDFTVSGPALYALTVTGAVLRTTDLVSWTPVATAPPGSRSIGAILGRLYVGTVDSRLYRLRASLAPPGTSLLLGLSLNASTVHAGDPLTANLSVANPGPAQFVDLFFGALLPPEAGPGLGCPSGDAVALVGDAFARVVLTCLSAPPGGFPPLFRHVPVPADLPPTVFPSFFSRPLPPGLPLGPYRLFVATTAPEAFLDETLDPGDVSTLATAEFAIVP